MLWLNLWSSLWRLEIENGDITHVKRCLAPSHQPSPNDRWIGVETTCTTTLGQKANGRLFQHFNVKSVEKHAQTSIVNWGPPQLSSLANSIENSSSRQLGCGLNLKLSIPDSKFCPRFKVLTYKLQNMPVWLDCICSWFCILGSCLGSYYSLGICLCEDLAFPIVHETT